LTPTDWKDGICLCKIVIIMKYKKIGDTTVSQIALGTSG